VLHAVGSAAATATTAGRAAALVRGAAAVLEHRIVVHDEAAAGAHLARLAERLEQTEAELLAGHLDESEARDLGDLVLRAVAREALDEAPQHEVAVRLEHHVDEVD